VLEGVFCQQLLPLTTGKGRALAAEVMLPTSGIRANIRDDKLQQIYGAIQTGGREGMQTMNSALYNLVAAGKITREMAYRRSTKPDDLKTLFDQGDREAAGARRR
jgi:twitching motility protein PilT